jgi:hypothetical protein
MTHRSFTIRNAEPRFQLRHRQLLSCQVGNHRHSPPHSSVPHYPIPGSGPTAALYSTGHLMARTNAKRGLRDLRRWIEFARCRIDREDAFVLMVGTAFALMRGANQYLPVHCLVRNEFPPSSLFPEDLINARIIRQLNRLAAVVANKRHQR